MRNLNHKQIGKLLDQISIIGLDNCLITVTETRNEKENGRFYKKNAVVTTETISTENYINIIESIPFFVGLGGTETISKGYTVAGFVPSELKSVSPDGNTVIIRTFKFEQK